MIYSFNKTKFKVIGEEEHAMVIEMVCNQGNRLIMRIQKFEFDVALKAGTIAKIV